MRIVLCLLVSISAYGAKTTVTGTFTTPSGAMANGTITARANSTWTNNDGTITLFNSFSTSNVTAGAGSINLYPNDATVQPGTSYTIKYSWGGQAETWSVPTSVAAVNVAAVWTTTQPPTVPSVMFIPRLVSQLPAAASYPGVTFRITNGANGTDCTTGGGSTSVLCTSSGSAWVPIAFGAQSGGCFFINVTGTCEFSFKVTIKPSQPRDGVMIMPVGTGSTVHSYWGLAVMNGDEQDYTMLGRSSSAYTTGGVLPWLPNNSSFIYYGPPRFRIGTGRNGEPNIEFSSNAVTAYGSWTWPTGSSLVATASSRTAPIRTVTTLPATCTVADQVFKTDASAGSNLYGCTATDIWTQMSGGGGGSGITAINSLSAGAQTLAGAADTNVTLAISSVSSTHTFQMGWAGVLSVARGGTGAATLTGVVKGNGASALTAAAASDVVALWTACVSGYLKFNGTCDVPTGGDISSNTSFSVDGEVVLFSGAGGKTIRRASGSGLTKVTSGVLGLAVSGTDYAPATSGLSVLKGNGSGGTATAVSGTDYAPATSGGNVLKGNGAGGFAAAVAGTDFAPITSGSVVLKGDGAGGTATAVAGTDYSAPATSETTSGGRTFTGALVALNATRTAPMKTGTTLPATCTVADQFFKSNATAGSNLYGCTATDTWTLQAGGSGGGGTVTVVSSGSLTSTALVTGGGTTTLQTPAATATLDASGNISTPGTVTSCAGCSTAGGAEFHQGTAQSPAANSVLIQAPVTIATAYRVDLPGAAASGIPRWSNSSNVVTESVSELSGDASTSGSNVVTVAKVNGVAVSGTPSVGYVPTATSSSAATWQAQTGGSGIGRTSASVAFASAIPDGACAASTMTWTGVTTSDTVIPGWPAALNTGLVGVMFVSASDTVTIRLCNESGDAVTPGTLTYRSTLAVYNLAGSATLNFGAIPDGGVASLTFNLVGVAAGDPVTMKLPAALETGLVATMVASATDTITVRLANLSGASVDPASQSFGASAAK